MHETDPAATAISAATLLVFGSMRESVVLLSLTTQTASGLVVKPPSLLAMPIGIVAATALVLMSTRASAGLAPFSTLGRSPHSGTHTLPNPAASPEHGRLPTSMVAATVLVFTSSRWIVFLGPLETQTASSVTPCQSGVPGSGNTVAGVIADISFLTPGVETPGGGWRLPFFSADCGAVTASCA